ncbi:MAG: hypothetical protein K2X35_18235 [Bryobacteraceae bacterium]|nr:hypothetical protein [Bryobacteraceae bacterium]
MTGSLGLKGKLMKFFTLVLFTLGIAAAAEPEVTTWDRVTALRPGTKVEVIHGNLKRLQGQVVRTSAADITVQGSATPETVAKVDVVRVSTIENSRKKRALLGLAIGAAAGAAAFVVGANAGDVDIRRDLIAGAGGAAGGGVGALVGAATGGPKTIYRRP